jgi:UDP-glucose 4-epimerase
MLLVWVARALERARPKSCVYLSSDGVYGFDDEHVDERTPVAPSGWYPVAKYAGERILQTSADAQEVPLLTIRPSAIFGPGDTHRAYGPNRFARSIVEQGVVRLFGRGEEIRDHVFIDDVVEATIGLAEKGATGVFNVASGAARTFSSIVDDLRAIAPAPFEVVFEPRQLPVAHRRHDVSRLRAALPELRVTPFDEGLAITLAAASA